MKLDFGCYGLLLVYLFFAYMAYGWAGVFWAMPLFVVWVIFGIFMAVSAKKAEKKKDN